MLWHTVIWKKLVGLPSPIQVLLFVVAVCIVSFLGQPSRTDTDYISTDQAQTAAAIMTARVAYTLVVTETSVTENLKINESDTSVEIATDDFRNEIIEIPAPTLSIEEACVNRGWVLHTANLNDSLSHYVTSMSVLDSYKDLSREAREALIRAANPDHIFDPFFQNGTTVCLPLHPETIPLLKTETPMNTSIESVGLPSNENGNNTISAVSANAPDEAGNGGNNGNNGGNGGTGTDPTEYPTNIPVPIPTLTPLPIVDCTGPFGQGGKPRECRG
jgi:hypothetical protein